MNKKEVADENETEVKPKIVKKITTIKSKPISPFDVEQERDK